MAAAADVVDPLQILSAALAVPSDSNEQADLLATLRESLEARPKPIPILCTTLIKTVSGAGDSLLKRWVLDLLHFAICRSNLSLEDRTNLASQSLEALAGLLHDPNPFTVKVVIQSFATIYPLLFRFLCSNRNFRHQWDILSASKAHILEFIWNPHMNVGIKLAAIKFMQRVILVQTRGISDPRLQNKNDPNLSMCPADHPFIPAQALEQEGKKLLEGIRAILFNSESVEILSAILNSWASLVKFRPSLVNLVISTLAQWTPAALLALPPSGIKSVEKSVRILFNHMLRSPNGSPYAAQIQAALATQTLRMEKAAVEERGRKNGSFDPVRKRPPSAPAEDPSEAKRQKLESDVAVASSSIPAASLLAAVDFTQIPVSLITDLVVANLQAFSEPALNELVQIYRQSKIIAASTLTAVPPVALQSTSIVAPSARPPEPESSIAVVRVKEEPVDPLQMDIDEEEFDFEPDTLNQKLSANGEMDTALDEEAESAIPGSSALGHVGAGLNNLQLIDFKLPPPKEFSEEDRDMLIRASVSRIWSTVDELRFSGEVAGTGASAADMWMLLVVRLVTRVAEPPPGGAEEEEIKKKEEDDEMQTGMVDLNFYSHQDRLRQTLCDYVVQDFHSRVRLAITWMNEEWYNDRIRLASNPSWRPNYDMWLNQIVAAFQTHLDAKDRAFSRFLLDLPAVPTDIMDLLRDLCVDSDRMQAGFSTLREFVTQRPTLRHEALRVLLELTTHQEKVTRGAAINTIKRWVPDVSPMDGIIREFTLRMLSRLQSRPAPEVKTEDTEMNGRDTDNKDTADENMEDGQLPAEEMVHTPYLPDELELPASKNLVLQHLELMFALTVKVPDFLDEIFAAYGQMDVSVQNNIQELITPLIRALGSSHGKLLTLMRTFPPGAESLALRVVNIFTDNGRPSSQLVALVKALTTERDLDARFLIPIIAEMDKADILRYLPRIVSILNGTPEPNKLLRSVFSSIVTTPPQTFGTVTSNMPRVRQSELLTPAELMVVLHESEKEIGLKSAIEAIGICFSMADIYRSEILAVVMQQIVDEPILPTLFLRTVIQAVKMYKSLIGFVSTTLLSRLITKKIWINVPLWEGFIVCAKLIAPASYGALLQLPKEQLRDLVEKQPSLKGGLRDYVMKKAGNKARTAGYLDIFGEEDDQQQGPPTDGMVDGSAGDENEVGQQQAVSVSLS